MTTKIEDSVIKKKKFIELNESDSERETSTLNGTKKAKNSDLTINKNYAQRYDTWRGKEELQKRAKNLFIYSVDTRCLFFLAGIFLAIRYKSLLFITIEV